MTGACSPPLPAERGVVERRIPTHNAAAHEASAMSGSKEAAAAQTSSTSQMSVIMMATVCFAVGVLLALIGLLSRGNWLISAAALWRDVQSPALGAAFLQLFTLVVCLCGQFSPSSSACQRRKYGALLLLAVVAGSLLPSANAVSASLSTSAEEVFGDISHWAIQSPSGPSPPTSRHALENHTFRSAGSLAEDLLPREAHLQAENVDERTTSRKLLQWPPGVSDADRSPGPDPEFLLKEKRLKDMSKKMEARLERSADFWWHARRTR